MPGLLALHILVSGLVQGVGFRPYVHLTAKSLGLAGFVRNSGGSEVEIWIEGAEEKVLEFLRRVALEVPEPAEVESVHVEVVSPVGYRDFTIERSSSSVRLRSMIPPDFGICDACLREVLDPGDRRYLYPLNSCVWCGPRYSMMYGVPYDRERTAMRDFPLCSECLAEYRDLGNRRRLHAQGISCPRCGPRVRLYTRDWEEVGVADPVSEAAKLIDEGYIVGVKGVGGYHIACLASDDGVVAELRRRKRRPTKPFAVMVLDVEVAGRLVELSEEGVRLLRSPQRPIVLLPKREGSPLSRYVSPGMSHEGVFLPYTALHYLLLSRLRDKFAVMTSGNVSDEPMCYDEDCARTKLSRIVDFFLVHERTIVNRVDDSVVRFTAGRSLLLRRGRGYAPRWVRIPAKLEHEVVALGADMHSAPAVAFEDKVVLAQYIGELVNGDTVAEFLKY
ncbi:MAG: carbamoyltransferase HypF, partial [Desulfurococcaceae archaeon]|nr:carbamoyltransferase HypF [Desulfurococcaceae archaeon]